MRITRSMLYFLTAGMIIAPMPIMAAKEFRFTALHPPHVVLERVDKLAMLDLSGAVGSSVSDAMVAMLVDDQQELRGWIGWRPRHRTTSRSSSATGWVGWCGNRTSGSPECSRTPTSSAADSRVCAHSNTGRLAHGKE